MVRKRVVLKKHKLNNLISSTKKFDFVFENDNILKNGVIDLLELLKQEKTIVKIFLKDNYNDFFAQLNCENIKFGNFNYYFLKDYNVLKQINLCSLRFIEIYLTNKIAFNEDSIKEIKNKACCIFSFDNYLEVTELIVNFKKYDNSTLNLLAKYFKK